MESSPLEVATLIEAINDGDPPPRQHFLDRQALATFFAGVLLLLISFTTNCTHGGFQHFGSLAIDEQLLTATKEEATEGADALVICTERKRFMAPNFDHLEAALRHKLIFDGRNL
jgi:hypothetical protein